MQSLEGDTLPLHSSGDFSRYPSFAKRIRELTEKSREVYAPARWAALVELIASNEIRGPDLEWAIRLTAALELEYKFGINSVLVRWVNALDHAATKRKSDPWIEVARSLIGHERGDRGALWNVLRSNAQYFPWTLDRLTRAVMIGGVTADHLTFPAAELEMGTRRLFGSNLFWSRFLRKQTSPAAHKGDAVELFVLAQPNTLILNPNANWEAANSSLSAELDRVQAASTKLAGTRLKLVGALTSEWRQIKALLTATGGRFEHIDRTFPTVADTTSFLATMGGYDYDIIVIETTARSASSYTRSRAPQMDGSHFLIQSRIDARERNRLQDFAGHVETGSELDALLFRLAQFAPETKTVSEEDPGTENTATATDSGSAGVAHAEGYTPALLPPQSNNALRFVPNEKGAMAVVVSPSPDRFRKIKVDLIRKATDLASTIKIGCDSYDLVAPMRPKLESYIGALQDGDYDIIKIWSAGNTLRRANSANAAKSQIPEGWYESFPPAFGGDLMDLVETHNVAMATHPDGVAFDAARIRPGESGSGITSTAQVIAEVLTSLPQVMEASAAKALSGVIAAADRAGELEDTTSRMEVSVGVNSFGNAMTAIVEEGQRQATKLSLAERQVVASEAQASALQEANNLARAGLRPSTWATVAKTAAITTAVGGGIAATTAFILSFAHPLIQLAEKMPLIGGALKNAIEALCRYFDVPI